MRLVGCGVWRRRWRGSVMMELVGRWRLCTGLGGLPRRPLPSSWTEDPDLGLCTFQLIAVQAATALGGFNILDAFLSF